MGWYLSIHLALHRKRYRRTGESITINWGSLSNFTHLYFSLHFCRSTGSTTFRPASGQWAFRLQRYLATSEVRSQRGRLGVLLPGCLLDACDLADGWPGPGRFPVGFFDKRTRQLPKRMERWQQNEWQIRCGMWLSAFFFPAKLLRVDGDAETQQKKDTCCGRVSARSSRIFTSWTCFCLRILPNQGNSRMRDKPGPSSKFDLNPGCHFFGSRFLVAFYPSADGSATVSGDLEDLRGRVSEVFDLQATCPWLEK